MIGSVVYFYPGDDTPHFTGFAFTIHRDSGDGYLGPMPPILELVWAKDLRLVRYGDDGIVS